MTTSAASRRPAIAWSAIRSGPGGLGPAPAGSAARISARVHRRPDAPVSVNSGSSSASRAAALDLTSRVSRARSSAITSATASSSGVTPP